MDDKVIMALGLLSLLAGLGFLGRYLYLDYKSKNEKSIVLISLGLLAFWFFSGNIMVIIAALLFALVFFRGC